jgi:hypothetical protein
MISGDSSFIYTLDHLGLTIDFQHLIKKMKSYQALHGFIVLSQTFVSMISGDSSFIYTLDHLGLTIDFQHLIK